MPRLCNFVQGVCSSALVTAMQTWRYVPLIAPTAVKHHGMLRSEMAPRCRFAAARWPVRLTVVRLALWLLGRKSEGVLTW